MAQVFANYRFRLEFDGLQTAYFQKASGLNGKVSVRKYEDGGSNLPQKEAGKYEVDDLELELGATKSLELWHWFDSSRKGRANKRSGALVVLDPATGTELERWNILNAWPIEFSAGEWDATSTDGNQMRKLKLTYDEYLPG